MKQLLAPVVALDLPVLGVISDAQISERLAVAQLWPNVPHQTCQFHYLREATRPMHDARQQDTRRHAQNDPEETEGNQQATGA